MEIKASKTFNQRFSDGLLYWYVLAGISPAEGFVVYGGLQDSPMKDGRLIGWQKAAQAVIGCRAVDL